jgi:hypothetical protein
MESLPSTNPEKCNIIQFFCCPPEHTLLSGAVIDFWTNQGTILTVCNFKGNPIKNIIFNKKTGVDLMKTH